MGESVGIPVFRVYTLGPSGGRSPKSAQSAQIITRTPAKTPFHAALIPKNGATHGEIRVQTPKTKIAQLARRINLHKLNLLTGFDQSCVYNLFKSAVRSCSLHGSAINYEAWCR